MDCQLLHQKSGRKFSVMKTKKNGVSRKIVCFGILIHVLSWRQQKHQSLCFHYRDFLTNYWRNNWQSIFDVVERLCFTVSDYEFWVKLRQYLLLCKLLSLPNWALSENDIFFSLEITNLSTQDHFEWK